MRAIRGRTALQISRNKPHKKPNEHDVISSEVEKSPASEMITNEHKYPNARPPQKHPFAAAFCHALRGKKFP